MPTCLAVVSIISGFDQYWVTPRWWSRRTCAYPFLWESQNCNWLLNNHPQENVGTHQEKIPHGQGQRRSHHRMVGRAPSRLKSAGWHHWLNGRETEQTPGNSEGQQSLVCCSPWGHKDSDMAEQQQISINNSMKESPWKGAAWNGSLLLKQSITDPLERAGKMKFPRCKRREESASGTISSVLSTAPIEVKWHVNLCSKLKSLVLNVCVESVTPMTLGVCGARY